VNIDHAIIAKKIEKKVIRSLIRKIMERQTGEEKA
jgi:hypothetical protein